MENDESVNRTAALPPYVQVETNRFCRLDRVMNATTATAITSQIIHAREEEDHEMESQLKKAAVDKGHGKDGGGDAGQLREESAEAGSVDDQAETMKRLRENESTAARRFLDHDAGVGPTGPLERDPDAPKDRQEDFSPKNYQAKVADPSQSCGNEAGVDPLLQQFQAVKVSGKSQPSKNPEISTSQVWAPATSAALAEPTRKESDVGISVREYVAEKLRPGEEDKALSHVISDAIRIRQGKQKEDEEDDGAEEALDEDKGEEEEKAKGESGVVEKLEAVVRSLFWKEEGSRASADNH